MAYEALFQPLRIKQVTIPNRFVSTSHQPGYPVAGKITDRYIRYEAEKAKGGVGLVQFGGATTVSVENCFYYGQVDGTTDAVVEQFRKMSDAIHEHGSVCTVQITHGGRRERYDQANWMPAFAPSSRRELMHRAIPAELEHHDIERICADYAATARRVRDGGVDGVELNCIPPGLVAQFWSPLTNQREDEYGGSLANRMRFSLDVLAAIRSAVGDDYLVGIRLSGDEMKREGLDNEQAVEIAQHCATSGLVDYISVVGGHSSDYKSTHEMYPTMHSPTSVYLDIAAAVKAAVDLPVLHATRIIDAAAAAYAVESGKIDLVGMTRAFIADPHHVNKLRSNRETDIRPCVGATYCIDRVSVGLEALCMHNVATSREEFLPQIIERDVANPRKVVVVGGGPAGLEAARVCAARGHDVTLFEAASALGGQLILASKAPWRRDVAGVIQWLVTQVEALGVEVKLNQLVDADDVIALAPHTVIVATGGIPNVGYFAGSELATTVWDVLSGQVQANGEVLIFDEAGQHSGLSCAQALGEGGATVELVSPDRAHGMEVGLINLAAHMGEIYRHAVRLTVDTRLVEVRRKGNKLVAVLQNSYDDSLEERLVDQVIGDYGTHANDDLYVALKPLSRNLGQLDMNALAAFEPQLIDTNADGTFFVYRVGDAWASRNVHAAMLDAMRICKDI